MRIRTILGCLLMFATATLAQRAPVAPPRAAAPAPAAKPAATRSPSLVGDDGKPIDGVRLVSADVKAVIRGPLAEASITLNFRNETKRVLGGELTFPLPEGATVAGYALDVDGVLVDGVAVEKQRARVIYEAEMNKRVDPGLVEHVAGNNFRTRLYPVPANGTRTLRVTYVADLVPSPDGKGASFVMPMGLGENLAALDLTVAVEGATQPPSVSGGTYSSKDFQGTPRGYYLKASLREARAVDSLRVLLPEVPEQSVVVQTRKLEPLTIEEVEAAAKQPPAASENYFLLTDVPKPAERKKEAAAPRHVLVVWDASLSRASADTARELKLLEQCLARLGHPAIDLALLRNDLELAQSFSAGADSTAKLIEQLKAVKYDGGTNFGALSFPKNRTRFTKPDAGVSPVPNYDLALCFTDGLGSIGQEKPQSVEIPVYAMSSDPAADHARLRSLCQQSGGTYLNLNRLTDAAAIDAIGHPQLTIIGIECDPAKVADVSPGVGTAVGQRLTVAGKLLAAEAQVTLVYGYGKDVADRRTFTIKAADATEGPQVPRFWAQQKAAELSQAGEPKREELVALGKRFGIVTPETSLLVLETADQYVQHGVVPPKSRPDVFKAFSQKIETRRLNQAIQKEDKLKQVLAMWEEKKRWWATEFKPSPEELARVRATGNAVAAGAPADGADAVIQRAREISDLNVDVPNFSDAPNLDLTRQRGGQQGQGGGGGGLFGGGGGGAAPAGGGGGGGLFGNGGGGAGPRGTVVGNGRNGKGGGVGGAAEEGMHIAIQGWDPKTPYLASMRAVRPEQAYAVYLLRRDKYAGSPAFYLDCADHLLRNKQRALGIRVLTNIAEMKLEDARLIRIVAHRLQQVDELDLAVSLFERVLKLRPEEPQSLRDLALALAARADAAVAAKGKAASAGVATDYGRALDLLNQIVVGDWNGRFPRIEVIALMEANAITAKIARVPNLGAIPNPIDPRLRQNLDCDLRIVLTWDADQTDIDLWVIEPTREACMYSHNRTLIGGAISDDFTQGYGPEEYAIRKGFAGSYRIQANFFGSRQQEVTGPCTVQATVISDFGRPNEKRQSLTLRLTDAKETVTIGTAMRQNAAPK